MIDPSDTTLTRPPAAPPNAEPLLAGENAAVDAPTVGIGRTTKDVIAQDLVAKDLAETILKDRLVSAEKTLMAKNGAKDPGLQDLENPRSDIAPYTSGMAASSPPQGTAAATSGNSESGNSESGNSESGNPAPEIAQLEAACPNGLAQAQPEAAELEAAELEAAELEAAELEQVVTGFLPVLRNLNFLSLWTGQVFSQIADKVYLVLVIGLISDRFQAEGQSISGWVSGIMIAFTIPAVLFGSIAGALVGRFSKQQVLVISNVLRGALVLLIPLLLENLDPNLVFLNLPVGFWAILVITFLVSTLTQFFAPAEQAIIPLIVEERNLLPANSLYTTTMMAATIVGFAIGEQTLTWAEQLVATLTGFSHGKPLAVGLSYIFAGGLLLLVRAPEAIAAAPAVAEIWQDIREGIRYLRGNRPVRSALLELVVLFSVFAAIAVLAVRMAEVIPELDTDQFGWLLSAGSVGLAIGALLVGQFGQRIVRAHLGFWGTLGMVAALLGVALFTDQLAVSLGGLGLFGFCAALVAIPAQTTIQEQTPVEMRGKIFGLQNNAVNIALSLPLALAGVVEHWVGLRLTLAAVAGVIVLGNLATWFWGRDSA
jgi:MFS family permease